MSITCQIFLTDFNPTFPRQISVIKGYNHIPLSCNVLFFLQNKQVYLITFVLYQYHMKLVFATNNQHKLHEVQRMLPDTIQLVTLKDIGCYEDIAETETTLEGNAQLKANHITEKYHFDCFADDTGIEVESLDRRPGVYSARYGGEPRDAHKNMDKLLTELHGKANRKAQFRTVIALHLNGEQYLFEGICEGSITEHKSGTDGFGYDPIFQPDGYSVTFAEMSAEEKNSISHRGIAIQKLVKFLIEHIS